MASEEIPIEFVERLSIVICRLCQSVVSGSRIEHHLANARHRFLKHNTKALRTALWLKLGSSQGLNLEDLKRPDAPILAIPGLPIFRDGLACEYPNADCGFVARYISRMHRHLSKAHGWINEQPTGRRRTAENLRLAPWRLDVMCQQFVSNGNHSTLFEVFEIEQHNGGTLNEPLDPNLVGGETSEPAADFRVQPSMLEGLVEVESIIGSVSDPWVEHLEWLTYLSSFSRSNIVELGARIDREKEPAIHFISTRMTSIVDTCIRTFARKISNFFRYQINKEAMKKKASKPFNMLARESSIARHTEHWSQMVRIVLRLYLYESKHKVRRSEERALTLTGDLLKFPELGLTRYQRQETRDLLKSVNALISQNSAAASIPSSTISVNTTVVEQEEHRLSPMDWRILQWCICLFDQEYISTFESPVICSLAIMGVTKTGWVQPEVFTAKMSATIKIVRLMLIQKHWQTYFTSDSETEPSPVNMTDALANDISSFMTIDRPTAMYYLLSNVQYSIEHINAMASLRTNFWRDDVLNFENFQISREDLQGLTVHVLSRARRVLTDEILFVEDVCDLPKIDLANLQDNQSDTSLGHMFTQNKSNHFPADPVKWFMKQLSCDAILANSFFSKINGLNFRPKDVKPVRVQSWIDAICKLKEYLLILIYISGGIPARPDEVLSIRFCNDIAGLERNIFIEDGLMLFSLKYRTGHVTSSSTKTVLRYLPPAVGELLSVYLWLVLPNQRRFSIVLEPPAKKSSAMWPLEGDIDKLPWTVERMEIAFENVCVEAIDMKLNVNSYRHIAIAFARKFLEVPLDHEDLCSEEDEESYEPEHKRRILPSQTRMMNEQAAHCALMVNTASAQESVRIDHSTHASRLSPRALSEQWHEFLGYPFARPSDQTSSRRPRNGHPVSKSAKRSSETQNSVESSRHVRLCNRSIRKEC